MLSVVGDVPVDSEALVVNFFNLEDLPAQSLEMLIGGKADSDGSQIIRHWLCHKSREMLSNTRVF